MSSTIHSDILKSRQHYEILDGLRGVAAISVVIFHFMEIAVPDYEKNFFGHTYLAVDFFFCLSGFVIAYAYDTRLGQMGIANFIKLRLIRLHPLVIIGSILGILSFVYDPMADLYEKYGVKEAIVMFITSCLMIPYPKVPERYYNLFHLNPPTWSLMWEYIANIVYAFALVKIKNKLLWILVIAAAVLLCYEAYRAQHLMNGWGINDVLGGFARVAFSFMAGILVYRSQFIIKNKLGFIGIAILTFAALVSPFSKQWAWVADPIIVILYLPLLVALGAGAQVSGALKKVCKFSGDISYPLYMVHYPFIWLFMSYLGKYKPTMDELAWVIPVCTVLLIIFAYGVLKFIDEPIRKYYRRKMNRNLV